MTDDDLARALRRMDPAETPLDAPLPLDAERRLRQILDRPPVRRRRPALAWTSAAAAVVVILTIVTGVLWMPGTSASALTPKPLVYTAVPSGTGAAEVIAQAQERLAAGEGDVAAERRSLSLGWYFSASPDGAEATVFRREWVDLRWNEDFSGSVVTTAAEATNADGDTVPNVDPAPGTVVGEMRYVRNQFRPLSPAPPDASAEAMRALLTTATGATEALNAGDALVGVRSVQGEWTLSNAQQSALLDVVAASPGLRALGTTEDRLGRAVVGLAGIPSVTANTEVTLLLSTETGRIVGFESALIDANTDLDLPAGSLTEYALWDAQDREDAPR
ncbi:hypothetical protein RWH44_13690 [Microbacterium sp. KSW2-29]|uniref:Uncharacterized protein n=1 Tax=Microbacterium phycohabitans TaxID=3075993 RepID=A0ABU3SPV4_9MICO|nr:hypothetical protein [Microbacterium sp. KSW2-29]MDU0346750.1 hypothetical protein [Microbacterium sp. KSW2-29]